VTAIVRDATAADVPALSQFLSRRFGGRASAFTRVFGYSWAAEKPDLGLLIEDEQRIRGFIGAMYSDRPLRGEVRRFCNIHDFVVDPEYRALTLPMLGRLLAPRDRIYTCFSASPTVIEILKFFGFRIVDGSKVVFTPLSAPATRRRGVRLHAAADVPEALDAAERRLLEDHSSYRCGHFVLEAKTDRCYFVTIRRGRDVRAFADVLHASDPSLLAACAGHVHAAVTRRHLTPLLGLDRRFVRRAPPGAFVYDRTRPVAYRAADVEPQEVDALYSELVPWYG